MENKHNGNVVIRTKNRAVESFIESFKSYFRQQNVRGIATVNTCVGK
jgi:hypothetical protein